MSEAAAVRYAGSGRVWRGLEIAGVWMFAMLWAAPLIYAFWSAFHPPAYATHFEFGAPLTLDNFARA